MQKIGQLDAFVKLSETENAIFVHPEGNLDQARLVKMRVLSEAPVALYVVPVDYDYGKSVVTAEHDDEDFLHFLTVVPAGLEQLEFYWRGSFALRLKGGNIWLDTFDNTAFNVESADPTSFARLWEREERDPRILEIERAARYNQMRFAEQLEAERAAFRAEMARYAQEVKSNVAPSAPSQDASSKGGGAEGSGLPSGSDSVVAPASGSGNGGA